MRKSALLQFSSPRVTLSALLALMLGLVVAGCGGGGGGGGPTPTPTPSNTISVSGRVVGRSQTGGSGNVGVAGVTVSIPGTSLSAQTGSDGRFQLNNVPTTASQLFVQAPGGSNYINYVSYVNKLYDQTTIVRPGETTPRPCYIPLPAPLKVGTNTYTSDLIIADQASPPPPPIGACP